MAYLCHEKLENIVRGQRPETNCELVGIWVGKPKDLRGKAEESLLKDWKNWKWTTIGKGKYQSSSEVKVFAPFYSIQVTIQSLTQSTSERALGFSLLFSFYIQYLQTFFAFWVCGSFNGTSCSLYTVHLVYHVICIFNFIIVIRKDYWYDFNLLNVKTFYH